MENMTVYNAVRKVPQEALKTIKGGRLNGMSDINPMFRIQALTEQFGPCGIGWAYTITRQWLEQGAGDTVCAFCNIDLQVKVDGEWSKAIPGTGGASFISPERSGPYTSDECWKMALTDALSVAAKALGVGADVYWQSGATKYSVTASPAPAPKPKAEPAPEPAVPGPVAQDLLPNGMTAIETEGRVNWLKDTVKQYGISVDQYKQVIDDLYQARIISSGKMNQWTKAEWMSVSVEIAKFKKE